MAALVQQLDHYSKVGIPKVQHQDYQSPFPFPEDEVEEGELVGHTNRELRIAPIPAPTENDKLSYPMKLMQKDKLHTAVIYIYYGTLVIIVISVVI